MLAKAGGGVVVRAATEDDVAAVHRVRVVTWQDAYAGIVPEDVLSGMRADDPDAIAAQRDRFRQAPPRTHLLVAEVDRRVVGFAAIGPEREDAQPGSAPRLSAETGEVYAIYVLPGAQRRGVGRALLTAALQALAADGFGRATLWVLEANAPARTFYERLGMRPSGERQPITLGVQLTEARYATELPMPSSGVD